MCAPPMWPVAATTNVTATPNASATPAAPNACVDAETITAPGPIATRMKVPTNSAA